MTETQKHARSAGQSSFVDELRFLVVVVLLLWAAIGWVVGISAAASGATTAGLIVFASWGMDLLVLLAMAAAGDD